MLYKKEFSLHNIITNIVFESINTWQYLVQTIVKTVVDIILGDECNWQAIVAVFYNYWFNN